jgi:hypothetical protein
MLINRERLRQKPKAKPAAPAAPTRPERKPLPRLQAACGHEAPSQFPADHPNFEVHKAAVAARKCRDCRVLESQSLEAAAHERKAKGLTAPQRKKAAFEDYPEGACLSATRDADGWTGSLAIDGELYTATDKKLWGLLWTLRGRMSKHRANLTAEKEPQATE